MVALNKVNFESKEARKIFKTLFSFSQLCCFQNNDNKFTKRSTEFTKTSPGNTLRSYVTPNGLPPYDRAGFKPTECGA